MSKISGKCYCGEIQYEVENAPIMRVQCHCRECQYMTGGNANFAITMPEEGFVYIKGTPKQFIHPDGDKEVCREFCGTCGTHITANLPSLIGAVILKVGTLDDPSIFNKPDIAIYLKDKYDFHQVPVDVPQFQELPE